LNSERENFSFDSSCSERSKLDAIEVLESLPDWHQEVVKSKTSQTTYKHLGRFIKRTGVP
jgi:hypothetical protein